MLAARPWAVAVAVAAHLALGAWLWFTPVPPTSGAVATGSGGVELALGPAGSSAGATTPPESLAAELAAEPEPLPSQTTPPIAADVPPPAAALAPVTDLAALPAPDSTTLATAMPEPTASPPPKTVTAAEPPSPRRPVPASKPVARLPAEAPAPRPVTTAPAGASGQTGTTDAPNSGDGDRTAGGGEVGDSHDYLATLAAWLERHKQYPQQARTRGEEGTVLLRFTIDRSGQLLAWRIDRGSGSASLDREVGAMLQRAEPLPPMPASMAQAQLELAVPIRFRLR